MIVLILDRGKEGWIKGMDLFKLELESLRFLIECDDGLVGCGRVDVGFEVGVGVVGEGGGRVEEGTTNGTSWVCRGRVIGD